MAGKGQVIERAGERGGLADGGWMEFPVPNSHSKGWS